MNYEPSRGYFAEAEHRFLIRVHLEDISGGNHVYNGHYLKYFERARTSMFQLAEALDPSIGKQPYEEYQVVAVEQQFLRPASLHDVLTISTRIGHIGRSSCRLDHVMLVNDEPIATAKISLVFTVHGKASEQPRGWVGIFESRTKAIPEQL